MTATNIDQSCDQHERDQGTELRLPGLQLESRVESPPIQRAFGEKVLYHLVQVQVLVLRYSAIYSESPSRQQVCIGCQHPKLYDQVLVLRIRLTVTYFSSSYDTLLKDLLENLATSGSCSRWEFRFLSSTYCFNPFTTPALPASEFEFEFMHMFTYINLI